MFCPKCGAEYRQGFAECSDCQVALVPDPPPGSPAPIGPEDLEDIEFTAFTPANAGVIRSILEAEGIEYFLADENMGRMYGSLALLHPPRLTVRKEDAPKVREILAQLDAPAEPLEE